MGDLYAFIPAAAFVLDAVFGDPRSRWHPVVLMGDVISFYEKCFYPQKGASESSLLIRGGATVFCVLSTVGAAAACLLMGAWSMHPYAAFWVGAVLLYITVTPHSLARDGMDISNVLQQGDLPSARKKLSWIVGRDTESLDESEIARGVIETIAENTTDGIISPLFWFFFFGPVGAVMYRAANTMDSMLGYKNERYLFFGRAAARLDDILNYVPARLTYVLFATAAFLTGADAKGATRMGLRDASKHPSPNGGYAEASVAGALHIRLGGYNTYGGKKEFRAYMGDAERPIVGGDIRKTLRLMYGATLLFIAAETIFLRMW